MDEIMAILFLIFIVGIIWALVQILLAGNKTETFTSLLPVNAQMEILNGRLPKLLTNRIFLKKGEYCCYMDKAVLLSYQTKRVHYFVSYSASRPGWFCKYHRYTDTYGRGESYNVKYIEPVKAMLYMTNQRIILHCHNYGFDMTYKDIAVVTPYSDGIEFQFKNKTYILRVPNGNLPFKVVEIIQKRRSI